MNLWPPGPCPPSGLLRGEGCDLGARLLDVCYTAEHIQETVRPALQGALEASLEQGDGARSALLLTALLDSWPVAALADAGVRLWTERSAAAALPVLGRTAELLCLAHGWSPVGAGPWPMPDADWIRSQVPEGVSTVCSRGEGDGADVIGAQLGLVPVSRPWALPAVERVDGSEISDRRAALARRLVRAEIAAVEISGALPSGPEAALAMGEIRMEALAQASYERFGAAGLIAPRAPLWHQILRPAAPGTPGDRLQQTCDTAILPGPPSALERGEGAAVGWLLWRGPHAPVPVQPEAVALLAALDGKKDLAEVAETLGAPRSVVDPMAEELVRLGAASA